MTSKESLLTASDEFKRSCESGNMDEALSSWKKFKRLSVVFIGATSTTELSTVDIIRSSLELGCLLHVKNEDVDEFNRCFLLLQPIYIDYPDPILPSSLKKPLIMSLQLLRLLTPGRIGDFHVELQKLSSVEKSSPELKFVIDLEMNLMSGNFEKCVSIINSPPNPHLQFFCYQFKDSLRHRVASCIRKSHTEISMSRAKQLLMLETEEQVCSVLNEVTEIDKRNDEDDSMNNAVTFGRGEKRTIRWDVHGDRIRFTIINDKKNQIPVNEVMQGVIGYAAELERIV